MDQTLQALYHGRVFPAEQYLPVSEEYRALRKKQCKHYEDFIKKLGSPLKEEFIEIMDEQLDTLPFEFSQMFIDGFRLGARMVIEIFDGQIQKEAN